MQFLRTIEYKYIVAILYTLVLFLDRLDLTIVNIALPTLAQEYGIPITQTEWISTAFLLALAISIPVSTWLGDRFGLKKVFILATALFGIASLGCAFAAQFWQMVLGRFLQGIGGGIVVPVGMAMLYRVFEPKEYASITSFVYMPALIAPALAPALGGVMMHLWGWPSIFIFGVPLCFVAAVLAFFLLKDQNGFNPGKFDWQGFIFSALFLTTLLYAISITGKQGKTIEAWSYLLLSIVSGALFWFWEGRAENPLINLTYFKNKLFMQANIVQVLFQICHFGSIFFIGLYLQVGIGFSPVYAGLIMGMQAFGSICVSRYSVRLFNRYGPARPIMVGFTGVAVLTLSILLIQSPQNLLLGLCLLFVRGLFSGLCGVPIQAASIIGFSRTELGIAGAIVNAGRQASISLGVMLSSLWVAYGYRLHHLNLDQPLNHYATAFDAFIYAFLFIPVVALSGIVIAYTMKIQRDIPNVLSTPKSELV